MKFKIFKSLVFTILFLQVSCKKQEETSKNKQIHKNQIEYATGFELFNYDTFSVLKITKPWPNSEKNYTYVLSKDFKSIPDSLASYQKIQIPIQKMVATSTTHIPSLVALHVENSLVGFPGLDYISNKMVRERIKNNKIKELNDNENINLEMVLDLEPNLIVAHSYEGENKKFDNIKNAGINIVYNGDWVENSPLAKAEWIKFFGALYDKNEEANLEFQKIVDSYNLAKELVNNLTDKPSVLSGAMYQDVWYLPEGDSWMAQFIKDAGGNYLWSSSKGNGSISLGFEAVYDKAQNAQFWIGPGQYQSYEELKKANIHYSEFSAFKNKKIYSYSIKQGEKGGVLFYEEASNRPDLVLKDFIYILHPNKLPNYKPYFIESLKHKDLPLDF